MDMLNDAVAVERAIAVEGLQYQQIERSLQIFFRHVRKIPSVGSRKRYTQIVRGVKQRAGPVAILERAGKGSCGGFQRSFLTLG